MIKKNLYVVLFIMTAAIALTVLVELVFRRPNAFHGTVINPPLPVTDFALPTANEEVFRLSDQKGMIVLLFFGYTSCPDVCPTTLATFKQVYERLGDDAQRVRFVLITADPDRDTPEIVSAYTARFNPEFIGLSGHITVLEGIWKELGVFVEKQDSGSAAGYLVSHTASVYVLEKNAMNVAQERLDLVSNKVKAGLESTTVDLNGTTSIVNTKGDPAAEKKIGFVRISIKQKELKSNGQPQRKLETAFTPGAEDSNAYDNFVNQLAAQKKKTAESKPVKGDNRGKSNNEKPESVKK